MALPIQRLNANLEGDLEYGRRVWSVPFALPGDLVQFQLKQGKKKSFKVVKIERADEYPAELELSDPFCRVFGQCGGCRGQHLRYDYQLDLKCAPVESQMKALCGIQPVRIAAPRDRAHRHRMDFAINGSVIGQRPAGDFRSFVDIEECAVQSPMANHCLQLIRSLLSEKPQLAFNRSENQGILKYCTIRTGFESGVIILNALQEHHADPELQNWLETVAARLQNELPQVSLLLCQSDAQSENSVTEDAALIYGRLDYTEKLGGIEFSVPYNSFFQPNPPAFDLLLDSVLPQLHQILDSGAIQSRLMLDLYCGSGVLSRIISQRCQGAFTKIQGLELVPAAIQSAPTNQILPPEQLDFRVVDLNSSAGIAAIQPAGKPGLLVMDPPRPGIHKDLAAWIINTLQPECILYISCNPQTQIRDLALLQERYKAVHASLCDCYPQTAHLEQAVILLPR
ncbi:MAG: class I SAM-dependent RNA methyltransferase [Leptospiraceae bacterium]|nr:class I SAM-dependent RNA methyltransferase [Leptospiraceae bacterium]